MLGRPGPRQQLPDRGHPPGQRRAARPRPPPPGGLLPRPPPGASPAAAAGPAPGCCRARPALPRPSVTACSASGRDRQPPLACSGPQPLADLVEPAAAAPQPGQVGLGRGRVHQHRPGRHGEEHGRPAILHGGDRVLVLRPGRCSPAPGRPPRVVQSSVTASAGVSCPPRDRVGVARGTARPRPARPAGLPRCRPGAGRRSRGCRTWWRRTGWRAASARGNGRPGHVLSVMKPEF